MTTDRCESCGQVFSKDQPPAAPNSALCQRCANAYGAFYAEGDGHDD